MAESVSKTALPENVPAKRYLLPKYPWIDTFFTLSILMAIPYWLSTICLILYVVFGSDDMLNNALSTILSVKFNVSKSNGDSIFKHWSLPSFLLFLVTDGLCMTGILLFLPSAIPYILLFGKALLASNLTSTRRRYILDAISTSCALILIEYSFQFIIDYFDLIRSESGLDLSLSFSTSEMLMLDSLNNYPSISKKLIHYMSLNSFHYDSSLMFQLQFCLQFIHATLSLYTIMHSINPVLRKTPGFKQFYALTDTFDSNPKSYEFDNNEYDKISHSSTFESTRSQELPVIKIDSKIANSTLPRLTLRNINQMENIDTNSQVVIDVSSPTLIVAKNFENFCKSMWSPKEQIEYSINCNITNISPRPSKSKNLVNSNSSLSNSSTSSNANNSASSKITAKIKNVNSDKIRKYYQQRYQQPVWTLLNAAKTMFFERDYYSGDYYGTNALATTGYGYDDYCKKMMMASPQCFIWYIGETTLAFELHAISLEQLLIKVNGIIWPHVSSCRVSNKELVFVNGLSPLFQYDIEFIKITINGELIHLSTNTVCTTFKDRSVTQSIMQSPITTMQNSVATTQEAIEREKVKLKKLKTDWRKKLGQLKSEIENLNSRPNHADESRNYKKLENLRSSVSQIDVSVNELSKENDKISLDQIEIDEAYLDAKREFENELRCFKNCSKEFHDAVDKLKFDVKNLEGERDQQLNKKEKILNKKLKFQREVENVKKWIFNTKEKLVKDQQARRNELTELRISELDSLRKSLPSSVQ